MTMRNLGDAIKTARLPAVERPEPKWIERKCKSCGATDSYTDDDPECRQDLCPQCRYEQEEERKRQSFEQHVISPQWWGIAVAGTGVPTAYRGTEKITLPKRASLFVEAGGFLTLQGELGTGKTWTGTKAFGERLRRTADRINHFGLGLWLDTSDALQKIKREWRTDRDGATMRALVETPLLMLDDVGAEPSYEYAQADLSYLIRQRYNWKRDTVVTCQSLDHLEGRLASRLASGVVIMKTGKDQRVAAGTSSRRS